MEENTQVDQQPVAEEPQESHIETSTEAPEEKPQVDLDQLRSELKDEFRSEYDQKLESALSDQNNKIVGKLSEVFGLTEEEEGKPIYNQGEDLNEYLEKYEGWKQKDLAKKTEEYNRQQEELSQQTKSQQDAYIKNVRSGWDFQTKELIEEGKLPAIKNAEDQEDAGVKAKNLLFSKMNEINAQRKEQGIPQTFNLHEVYNRFYKGGEVAGADAPILGASIPTSGSSEDYAYEDIHGKNPSDLF